MYLRVDNNETEEREFSKRKEVGEVADLNANKNDKRIIPPPNSIA